jgi:molybdopterin-guanine dinucleotide biosynthesis protein A
MTSPRRPVTGIVLAGGRSSRFGSDKLVARLDGRSLLDRAIDALAGVTGEVVVVVAPNDDRALPSAGVPVRRVMDAVPFGGPLIGLRAGLEAAAEPTVVVVGGDMPSLRTEVLAALIRALIASPDPIGAAVLALRSRLIPLPAALRTGAATHVVTRLVDDGERRLRSLYEHLPTRVLEEPEWRALDPDGETLRDVDTPADL